MKQLPVRFNNKQTSQLADLVELLGSNTTDTARAALALGMQQIKEIAARNPEKAQELVVMSAHKAMQ